jgi:HK97 family phage prohead protease
MIERIEIKTSFGLDDAGAISGTAWPFGTPDRVGDMIEKGAFHAASATIPMLFAHDPAQPVGVWTAAVETENGLEVRGKLLIDDVARAREVRALVKEGAIGGLSIGFTTKKSYTRKGGGRTITALDLVEISLVTIPMHPGARIASAKTASLSAITLAEAINHAASAFRKRES